MTFLHGWYRLRPDLGPLRRAATESEANARSAGLAVEKALFDLALRAGETAVAQEVYDAMKARDPWPGLDLALARIQATRGEQDAAIATREFRTLHADPRLRSLLTETPEGIEARRERRARKYADAEVGLEGPRDCTLAGVRETLRSLRSVTGERDEKNAAALKEAQNGSHLSAAGPPQPTLRPHRQRQ